MPHEVKKVRKLKAKQRKLHAIMTVLHGDVQVGLDIVAMSKLKETYAELEKVQHKLLEHAVDNGQETESLKEEGCKYARLMAEITAALEKQPEDEAAASSTSGGADSSKKQKQKKKDKEVNSSKSPEEPIVDDSHTEEQLPSVNVNSSVPPKYLNLLLLGETGSGKSTFINSSINYYLYSTLKKASKGDFKQLIPTKFSMAHPETHKPVDLVLGEDANESHAKVGTSVTQEPREYFLPLENGTILRLIDTPGMGDTRGTFWDVNNCEKILTHLLQLIETGDTSGEKELHGIVFFIKASETRKTVSFRYCINELLTRLHKDAAKNMVFLFTFSNSYSRAGFALLESFLTDELSEANIELIATGPDANCFFLDNEAYLYLVAKKLGHPFTPRQERSYAECWEGSVKTIHALLHRLSTMPPHRLESTLSMNYALKLSRQLSAPLAELVTTNSANLALIQKEEERLVDTNLTKDELAQTLSFEIDDLASRDLVRPYTVCTKCTSFLMVNGVKKVEYSQKCHELCALPSVEPKVIGDPELVGCSAMDETGICIKCGCSWNVHMHTKVDFYRVKKSQIDVNKRREFQHANEQIDAIKLYLRKLKALKGELEAEQAVLHQKAAVFACIPAKYSNSPYNRFFEPHISMLIDEEEKMINASNGVYSSETKEKLLAMLSTHRANVDAMKTAMEESPFDVDLEDIDLHLDELKSLKHAGRSLKQILATMDRTRIRELAEKVNSSLIARGSSVSMAGDGRVKGNWFQRFGKYLGAKMRLFSDDSTDQQ